MLHHKVQFQHNDFQRLKIFIQYLILILKRGYCRSFEVENSSEDTCKTTTQYAKADSETKKAYGEKLSEVYSFMKSSGMNYWWNYYSIENKNSAKRTKNRILKIKI